MGKLVDVNFERVRKYQEANRYYEDMQKHIFDLILNDEKLDNLDKQCILYGVISKLIKHMHNNNMLEAGIGSSHINLFHAIEKIRNGEADPNDCLW